MAQAHLADRGLSGLAVAAWGTAVKEDDPQAAAEFSATKARSDSAMCSLSGMKAAANQRTARKLRTAASDGRAPMGSARLYV